MIGEMMDFIDDNYITEFRELMQYARVHRGGDWFPLLVDSSTYVIDKYICSARNKMRQDRMDKDGAISVRTTVVGLQRKNLLSNKKKSSYNTTLFHLLDLFHGLLPTSNLAFSSC